MEDDRLNLHIVVNDEIIDLRQENFDRTSVRNRAPYRTTSQQLVTNSSRSINLNQEPLTVNGLKKLATNIYNGPSPAMLQKQKSSWRTKQRNRATSADPRFRRERSPILQKNAGQTQSDSQVMEPLPSPKKNKTQSDPMFILSPKKPVSKKSSVPKAAAGQCTEPKSEPIKKRNPAASSCISGTYNELGHRDVVKKRLEEKVSNMQCSLASNNYSVDTCSPSNIEQSTMTDELGGTLDCKSIYQSAITNLNCCKATEFEVFNASMSYDMDNAESINPYWDDPRLIEKYDGLIKPVQIRKSKSSWTLPLSASVKERDSQLGVCPKCTCTNIAKDTYAYETCTDYTDASVTYENTKSKIYQTMFKNYYLTAFFLLGSFCGLALVALVVWVLANDLLWNYLSKSPDSPKSTGFKWMIAYFGGGILYGINVVVTKIYHMIVMPRSEVFDPLKNNDPNWSIL